MNTTYDAIVIGGGPAGLQATLTLARVHRRVLMLDSGRYRNDAAAHMHNVVTHDGTPPADFRKVAREQVAAYPTAMIWEDTVTAVRAAGEGFEVVLDDPDDTVLTARGLVLATGVRDRLPDVPGVAELWGERVVHCPFCHGHEFADRPVAILGTQAAGHLPGILAPVVSGTTVLTHGEPAPDLRPGVAVRTEPVAGLAQSADGVRISFATGPDLEVAGVYVTTALEQAAPFAEQLGLTTLASGCVEVDVMGRTSLPRVHAAGDMAHVAALPMPMASVISAAASGAMAAGSLVAALL
jgi:thioredoxin reductase